MAKQKLTKEQIENIKNYGKTIESIDTFVQAVRQVPGMYIGSKGNKGFLNMIREVFQNAVDEIIKHDSPATYVIVSYDENTKRVIIEDNGRGIPYGDMNRIFTSQHTSSNYNKKKGEFSSGLHGIGSKITNALSHEFIVKSYILGKGKMIKFIEGVAWEQGEIDIPNEDNKQGTVIEFLVNEDVMGEVDLSAEIVLSLFTTIMTQATIGAVMHFNAVQKSGNIINETFVNTDGIVTNLYMKSESPIIKPIIISKYTGTMTVDVALTFDSDMGEPDITPFANLCPAGGVHVEGFIDGLCRWFRDYMNKIYLAKNKKTSVVNNDIKTGLKAIISIKHLHPVMEGQSKENVTNEDLFPFVKTTVMEQLTDWSKTNADDLQKIAKYFKEVAEIRIKGEEGKQKVASRYGNSITKMPEKYEAPYYPLKCGKCELYIFEGDSAGGSGKKARTKYQGIMPIRGKLPNAFTTPRTKFLANEEIDALIHIETGGSLSTWDGHTILWDKIIAGCDADPDGAHIETLILRFHMMYLRSVIEQGKLYRAVSPLFGETIGHGKNQKTIFYTDYSDLVAKTQKLFMKKYKISYIKNGEIPYKELEYLLNINENYLYYMNRAAGNYGINPVLLETILSNLDLPYDKIAELLKKRFSNYIELEKLGNTTIIRTLVNDGKEEKINTIYLNDNFLRDVENVKYQIDKNQFTTFKINGVERGLYELMSAFDKTTPNNIRRYKGLGEMNPTLLGQSTMEDENRVLVRYTMESAQEEINRMRYYESNRYELIKGSSASRLDLRS